MSQSPKPEIMKRLDYFKLEQFFTLFNILQYILSDRRRQLRSAHPPLPLVT